MRVVEPRPDTAGLRGGSGDRHDVYLQPGEIAAAREATAIKTLLGSCIAVCLWDPELRIGGMNHFLLPHGASSAPRPGRFGNLAMKLLVDELRLLGAVPSRLCAKVFGGASMLSGVPAREAHIGVQNSRVAQQLLAAAGIPIVGEDTGGDRGRKIIFHTGDGSVSRWQL